jgi:hypothetical protein
MSLKILCAGHLFRHPLGGHTWHHLQYLLGFERLGHQVVFVEHFGWENSCYDAARDLMTDDPTYGLAYMSKVFKRTEFSGRWCYLAADGTSHGMSREDLAQFCRECNGFFNLSNINWIDEFRLCRRRALVDTDPVFTQIGGHGMGGPFSNYNTLFTYGENVGKPGCDMPTAGQTWLPTRQPLVLDLWPVEPADPDAPLTTLINWTAYGDVNYQGQTYGQKDREFEKFFELPKQTGTKIQIAANAPNSIKRRFAGGGWILADPLAISRDPWTYQSYLSRSKGEFCVAKHGYVATRCGWFSDRSAAYLAMGRPAVLQDTGFTEVFTCGTGLLGYRMFRRQSLRCAHWSRIIQLIVAPRERLPRSILIPGAC